MENTFGRLPAELRNRIYDYLFSDTVVTLDKFDSNDTALLRVNSDIRKESRLMLFAKATLKLSPGSSYGHTSALPQNSIGDTLAQTFGPDAMALLSKRDIQPTNRSAMLRALRRRIRLTCPRCFSSGREGCVLYEEQREYLEDREASGYWKAHSQLLMMAPTTKEEMEKWQETGTWVHAGWTCWKN